MHSEFSFIFYFSCQLKRLNSTLFVLLFVAKPSGIISKRGTRHWHSLTQPNLTLVKPGGVFLRSSLHPFWRPFPALNSLYILKTCFPALKSKSLYPEDVFSFAQVSTHSEDLFLRSSLHISWRRFPSCAQVSIYPEALFLRSSLCISWRRVFLRSSLSLCISWRRLFLRSSLPHSEDLFLRSSLHISWRRFPALVSIYPEDVFLRSSLSLYILKTSFPSLKSPPSLNTFSCAQVSINPEDVFLRSSLHPIWSRFLALTSPKPLSKSRKWTRFPLFRVFCLHVS